jgi:hypothetical protein
MSIRSYHADLCVREMRLEVRQEYDACFLPRMQMFRGLESLSLENAMRTDYHFSNVLPLLSYPDLKHLELLGFECPLTELAELIRHVDEFPKLQTFYVSPYSLRGPEMAAEAFPQPQHIFDALVTLKDKNIRFYICGVDYGREDLHWHLYNCVFQVSRSRPNLDIGPLIQWLTLSAIHFRNLLPVNTRPKRKSRLSVSDEEFRYLQTTMQELKCPDFMSNFRAVIPV